MKNDNSNLETKNANELRLDEIKTLSSRYGTLAVAEKVKLLKFIQADIQSERERLFRSLNELDSILGGGAETITAPRTPQASNGEMSVGNAILEVLKGRQNPSAKEWLKEEVEKLTGKKLKDTTFTSTLQYLKGKKTLKNPGRGQWQLA